MSPSDDSKWELWVKDFDAAREELHNLFHTRWLWLAINGMLDNSGVQQYASVQNYLIRTYVTTICTGIRRECDPDPRSASLARCLQALIDCPLFASRDRYRSLLEGELAGRPDADTGFDVFASAGASFVDSDIVGSDLRDLRGAAAKAKRYTDKVLAHRDRATSANPSWISLTFGEMHNALDAVGSTMKKYYKLRHPGQLLAVVTPTPNDVRFLSMFEQPWLTDGFSPPNELDLG